MHAFRSQNVLVAIICFSALGVSGLACSAPKPPPPHATELWGDLKAVVSVKELMRYMIDPVADNIFDAVSTETTKSGSIAKAPKTDDDWEKVRVGAVSLAEGAYLLKIPRPFAPPGDENNSSGPDASELSPRQITAKLERDPVLWNAKIEALRNVGLEVLEIVKKRDVNALFDAGGDLDVACENCHLEYWYPAEKDLMPKLDRRLEELFGPRAPRPLASHRTSGPSQNTLLFSVSLRDARGDHLFDLHHVFGIHTKH